MIPVDFPEKTFILAENQPEYFPIPVHASGDLEGILTSCWKFTWKERLKILFGSPLWYRQMTFNRGAQPVILTLDKPDIVKRD